MNKTYLNYRRVFDFSDSIYNEYVSNNTYIKYIISIQYFDSASNNSFIQSYKKLYEGKTVLINRKTTIDFTDIINDLRFRSYYTFDTENQSYKPLTYNSLPLSNVKSIEAEGELVNTNIKVEFYNNISTDLIDSYTFPISIFEKEIEQPYNNFILPKIECYNKDLIEIPYIKTNNYFITIPFATYGNEKAYLQTNSSDKVFLTNGSKGNYVNSYTVNNIISTLEQSADDLLTIYRGGESDIVLSGGLSLNNATPIKPMRSEDVIIDILQNGNKLYLNDILLGSFNSCYDDWYLGWIDKRGFHSISLKQVEEVKNKQNIQILNIYKENTTLSTEIEKSFKIKTKRLTNEQYDNFINILEATNVVLYNTVNDVSFICNIEDNQLSYIRNNSYKEIELTLTNNIKNNY